MAQTEKRDRQSIIESITQTFTPSERIALLKEDLFYKFRTETHRNWSKSNALSLYKLSADASNHMVNYEIRRQSRYKCYSYKKTEIDYLQVLACSKDSDL